MTIVLTFSPFVAAVKDMDREPECGFEGWAAIEDEELEDDDFVDHDEVGGLAEEEEEDDGFMGMNMEALPIKGLLALLGVFGDVAEVGVVGLGIEEEAML